MLINSEEYLCLFEEIRNDILATQQKAVLHVNKSMMELYWRIGMHINQHKSWGNKFIENLSNDIRRIFPETKGFSVRNLQYMVKLANTYTYEFVQQSVAQIP